ncbi:MAG: CPBP family intramembrane metalloprotease [Acidobacteria bacterium]|nr:CPBP family intramembrane metalloprotease [Acidobacteriota bacterium]
MDTQAEHPRLYSIAWAFYLVLALAGTVWIGWRGDLGWRLFVDPARWWQDLAAGAGAGLALVGLWVLARRWLAAARRVEVHIAGLLGEISGEEIFALAVISGVGEELFFRGAVQGSWGWLWATALFAVLHTGPGRAFRLWTLFALVAGLVFAGLTLWSGNLLATIVAHSVVNGLNLRSVSHRRQTLTRGSEIAEGEPGP